MISRHGLVLSSLLCLTQCISHKLPEPRRPATPENRLAARQFVESLNAGKVFTWRSNDGAVLSGRHHAAKGGRKAVIIALHGMQSHSGWWTPMARDFTANGVEVWCPDRRGSGMNAAGHFESGDIESWRIWVEDVDSVVKHVTAQAPGVPMYLVGHSWGAVMAAAYLEKSGEATPVREAVLLSPGMKLGKLPEMRRTGSLVFGMFTRPLARMHIPTPQDIAGSDWMGDVVAEDPLMLRQVTYRYMWSMLFAKCTTNRNLDRIRRPVHLILAEKDVLIDNCKVKSLMCKKVDADLLTIHADEKCAPHTFTTENPERLTKRVLGILKL